MSVFFGDFALDQERRQLLRSGEPVPLGAKPYELLSLLLARRPRVLSKAQISGVLWPGSLVGETSLPRLVTDLRQALGDDPQRPRFIRTAHGFGYAFCGEAREDGPPSKAGSGGGQAGMTGAVDLPRTPAEERPYPGLSAFTENEAEQFFGREAEVAALWEKVRGQKLLALIGPSGVGKTSLVRAGVIAHQPEGWTTVYMTPGANPVGVLARELTLKLTSAPAALADLVQGVTELVQSGDAARVVSAFSRWRLGAKEALLVIDQFEELFTLNAEETQARLAMLLGRLAEEAGVHVLLSVRDDFLFRCHSFAALSPVFDHLTPLGPPSSEALRRALVEPAARHGVRFEDEALVDEMVGAVAKERGALPLLAFAASRLWDERDRERKLLARAAYERIGGVAGALVQHAEATLAEIGPERERVVRELFRNLMTWRWTRMGYASFGSAEGTRAEREREELLSVFAAAPEKRDEAEAVLDVLVGSRLLTEYDAPEEREGQGRQRIEIVHESLLTRWPRLVRWRAQDEEGAVLRDQLRQAARLWSDKGRPQELLWTGQTFQEYAAWRGRYEGSLSALEEDFVDAATRLAGRRRRRRHTAVAAALSILLIIAAGALSLWRRAEHARQGAMAEARRAEAAKLLALGQVELDGYPTVAVAYALKSLELADTMEARLFALRALQRGPTATLTPVLSADSGAIFPPAFSPNGEWLAFGGWRKVELFRRDGGTHLMVGGDYDGDRVIATAFGAKSDVLLTSRDGDFRIWSLPDGRELQPRRVYEQGLTFLFVRGDRVLAGTQLGGSSTHVGGRLVLRESSLGNGSSRVIGSIETEGGDWSLSGGSVAYHRGRSIYVRSLDRWESPPRRLAEHAADVRWLNFSPDDQRLVATDGSGQASIWPATAPAPRPLRTLQIKDSGSMLLDSSGRWLAGIGSEAGRALCRLWDLHGPPDAEPIELRRADTTFLTGFAFEPSGRWIATGNSVDATLWSIEGAHPHVFRGHDQSVYSLAFTPDGTRLVSTSLGGTLRSWPLTTKGDEHVRILVRGEFIPSLAVDSASRAVVLLEGMGRLSVVPLAGGSARQFEGLYSVDGLGGSIALEGHFAAVAPIVGPLEDRLIRIVDLETGMVRRLPPVPGALVRTEQQWSWLQFLGPDQLLASVLGTGLVLYDLSLDKGEFRSPQPQWQFATLADGRSGVGVTNYPEFTAAGQSSELVRFRIDGSAPETVPSHGSRVSAVALSPSGNLVATGSVDGTVRIGPVSGEEPFVFYGHEGIVWTTAFSPDGHWVASGGHDRTVRMWPVPDTSVPPPQSWDLDRLLAMLRARTNLRAEPDPRSSAGWKIARGPFPGWAKASEY